MKSLSYTLRYSGYCPTIFFMDAAAAAASYAKIRKAMEDFRQFGNDRSQTVEFDAASGTVCVRLEDLQSVSLYEDVGPEFEEALIQRRIADALVDQRIEDAVAAGRNG